MSWQCWHTYGYGVKISELQAVSMSKVMDLVQTAPKYAECLNGWLKDCEIEEPTLGDLVDFDEDFHLGLASLLSEVIEEREGIRLTACDDLDGHTYLLFEQTYPWRMSDSDKSLKEEDIQSLMVKYLSQITDEAITIDYYGPENGG